VEDAALEPVTLMAEPGRGTGDTALEAVEPALELGWDFGGKVGAATEGSLSLGNPFAMCFSNMFLALAAPRS
jgi:hypothetical protein